jgi:LAGLIDADG endonuclease
LIQFSLRGVGNITNHGKDSIQLRITSIKELEVIINHFDNHPLITQKLADYQLFKEAYNLVKNKNHLELEGLKKIVAIKATINKGLSVELRTKEAFPDVIPVPRPLVQNQEIKDPS